MSERQYTATIAELAHEHAADFPALTAALASTETSPAQDNALEFGLDRILDGIEAYLSDHD